MSGSLSTLFKPALMVRAFAAVTVLVIAGSFTFARAEDAPLRIEKVRIGYDGRLRPGRLNPVMVKCVNDQAIPANAQLRIIQSDQDGDSVEIIADMPLGAESTAWRTVLIRPSDDYMALRESRLVLGLGGDDDFKAVESLLLESSSLGARASGQVKTLGSETVAVAVIGNSSGVMTDMLSSNIAAKMGFAESRMFDVFSVPVNMIPSDWRALDMIDVIFWEDPDIASLGADGQRAIVQWVNRGGKLVIALGPRAMELSSATLEFRNLLPVRIVRTTVAIDDLGPLYKSLGRASAGSANGLICEMVRRNGFTQARSGGHDLLCRAPSVGGEVTVLAGRLGDVNLSNPSRDRGALLRALVGFPLAGTAQKGSRDSAIDFEASLSQPALGGILIGLALLLCVVYVLLAGPASWFFLKSKKAVKYSWWLYGGCALVASVAFTFLAMLRVTGTSASYALVIDMDQRSPYASVRGYCGVYIPAHGSAEVRLDRDVHASLSPMILDNVGISEGYSDVRKYSMQMDSPNAFSPFFRRTVKRFACNWAGGLSGNVSGKFRLAPDPDYGRTRTQDAKKNALIRWRISGQLDNTFDASLLDARLLYMLPNSDGLAMVKLGTIKANSISQFNSGLSAPTGGVKNIAVTLAKDTLASSLMDQMGLHYGSPSLAAGKFVDSVSAASVITRLSSETDYVLTMNTADMNCMDRSQLLNGDYALLVARMPDDFAAMDLKVDDKSIDGQGQIIIRILLPLTRVGGRPVPQAIGSSKLTKNSF